MIITGKTRSGFKYTVEKDVLTSWQFTMNAKAVQKAAKKGETALVESMDMMQMILGDEQMEALEKHLKDTLPEEKLVGGVQTEDMAAELKEILEKVSEKAKN